MSEKKDFEGFAGCSGCGRLTKKSDLNGGNCALCNKNAIEQASSAMQRADEHALANVSRTLLGHIAKAGKGEPVMPAVLESAMNRLGGPSAVGEIIGEQILIATGKDKSLLPAGAVWKYNSQVAFKWAELLARVGDRVDDRESLDVASLSQEDLVSNLKALAADLVSSSLEYAQFMHSLIEATYPQLASQKAVEAKDVKEVKSPKKIDPNELDYEEPSE